MAFVAAVSAGGSDVPNEVSKGISCVVIGGGVHVLGPVWIARQDRERVEQ
jgi:hypothetical protein